MLSTILKSNQPIVIVLIILSGILMWIPSFIDPIGTAIPSDNINMPFYEFIAEYVQYNSLLSMFITLLLVFLQSFLLVQFNKKHIIINYRTYLPAFFYILISGSFVQLQRLNPVLIGGIFIFAAINFIFSTYRTEYALNKLYLAGFFVSIASLFWGPLAIFILIIWISISNLRPFIGREWIVGLLGFLTPYLFVFVYYFVFLPENSFIQLIDHFVASFYVLKAFHLLHYSYYIFYGFLFFIIILASYTLLTNFQNKKIKTRKYFQLNWWIFIFSLSLFFIFKNVKYEIIYLMSIPVSFLLAEYFHAVKRNWYLNILLLLLVSSLVYIQIIAH
ncbi:MAG TPA: hypothetical protein DCG75_19085 [Bacteroidales bacterium]|jgi:hypothetical protein|nr:hypothetical protein [Bacteroidales bacterium]